MIEKIQEMNKKIKIKKPLILNMTNYVTMDFIANGLLSLGASPIMSTTKKEMEDLLKIVDVVVVNFGTLDEKFIDVCHHAAAIANELNKPIIFDPVGAGASQYRTQAAMQFIAQFNIAIIRGNASEIMALTTPDSTTKGVDSANASEEALRSAQNLLANHHAAVVISGETDVVVDEKKLERLHYGSAMMPLVTGTGCLFTAVLGAFHAVECNRFTAAVAATIFYGKCGELAAQSAQGPGEFKIKFLDALHFGL